MRSIFECAGPAIDLEITVNGERRALRAPPLRRLIDFLREDLALTGTKEGCGEGECGACTVLVDGEATLSCLVPVCQVEGARITTIEGGGFESIREAFLREGGAQCGICTPGMITMTRAWIDQCEREGEPCTLDSARTALAGNLCRCTGYEKILAAALAAARAEPRIRREEPRDRDGVYRTNERAFERAEEAQLVERLRVHADRSISMVAEQGSRIIGHVLFTPVTIDGCPARVTAMGLGPVAVSPEAQRLGIGSKLVRRGLELCRSKGVELVVVLGHPEYYPRFGFVPASRFGIRCEYDVRDEVFMALWLTERADACEVRGTVRYFPEFSSTV